MRILLIGKNGQVGYELQRSLACLANVIACDRKQLDLSNGSTISSLIESLKPDMIVNAAAYTAVDKAEAEPDLAMQINAYAVATMAECAKKLAIPLIHYSTDYVFNGDNQTPWLETDNVAPINVYGESKLAGEQAIADSGCQYLILRTSWVYGTRGHNFLLTMRRLAREKDTLSVVADQVGSPTWSRHIADVTSLIIAQSLSAQSNENFWKQHSGLYHLSGSGQGSWYDFANDIFEHLKQQGETVATLNKTTTSSYPTPATRPLYSVMNTDKLAQAFNLRLPDWKDSVALALSELD